MDRVYRVKEAAEKLRVHPMTIYDLIQKRELEAIRIGKTKGLRITEKALEDFIKRKTLAVTESGGHIVVHKINEGDANK